MTDPAAAADQLSLLQQFLFAGGGSLVEALKIIASMAIPYIALLRTRADIDRIAANMRAGQTGKPFESQLRKRWYHRLKRMSKHVEKSR